jgi:hypothetical protein
MYLTIPEFTSLSRQQIFDMAVKHIGSTGKKSNDGNGCLYTSSGCNAAPLLTEEGRQIADGMGSWPGVVEQQGAPPHEQDFIDRLQKAHDYATVEGFKNSYKSKMKVLARTFHLDTAELDKLGW